jgi:hypothetical protein
MTNIKQVYAIQRANEKRILRLCPDMPNKSGIYFLFRHEGNFKYAYVGQAKNLLYRVAQHLSGYQHIDLSLKKHGLYSEENPSGWDVRYKLFDISELDEKEQYYIELCANRGYQMRNKTAGGQGKGKTGLDNSKPSKGYYEGLEQGRNNLIKELKQMLKYLKVTVKTENRELKLEKRMLDRWNDTFE